MNQVLSLDMGRRSTGALTTIEICKIELSALLRDGLLIKNRTVHGSLSWSNGAEISIKSTCTDDGAYIQLKYTTTSNYDDEVSRHDYKIQLYRQPSNLGSGEVLYFVCPVTFRKCRILYKCYGSPIWKSRQAYRSRIYYTGQCSSRYDYHNERYWHYERKIIPKLEKRCKNQTYRGKPTKPIRDYERAIQKRDLHDYQRWSKGNMPIAIKNILG